MRASQILTLTFLLAVSLPAAGQTPPEAPAGSDVAEGAAVPAEADASDEATGSADAATEAARTAAEAARAAADSASAAAESARAAAESARVAAESARGVAGATPVPPAETAVAAETSPAIEEAVDAAEEKPPVWTGQVGLAAISVTGNAEAVTAKLTGTVAGEWYGWATKLNARGAYGQTRPEDVTAEPNVTALNGEATLRGDRKLPSGFAVYALVGAATDHVASIELQAFGESGIALTWLEDIEGDWVRLRLRTDLGFRIMRERRFQYYPIAQNLPDRTLYAPKLAAEFRYALSKTTVFNQQVEAFADVMVPDDLRLTSISALAVQIVEGFALQVAFTVRHVGRPAEGKEPTDTELSAGFTYAF